MLEDNSDKEYKSPGEIQRKSLQTSYKPCDLDETQTEPEQETVIESEVGDSNPTDENLSMNESTDDDLAMDEPPDDNSEPDSKFCNAYGKTYC